MSLVQGLFAEGSVPLVDMPTRQQGPDYTAQALRKTGPFKVFIEQGIGEPHVDFRFPGTGVDEMHQVFIDTLGYPELVIPDEVDEIREVVARRSGLLVARQTILPDRVAGQWGCHPGMRYIDYRGFHEDTPEWATVADTYRPLD